jgi:hypothetical protein
MDASASVNQARPCNGGVTAQSPVGHRMLTAGLVGCENSGGDPIVQEMIVLCDTTHKQSGRTVETLMA